MAYIVFEKDKEKNLVEMEPGQEILVGRVANCDIRFSSKDRVSRQHCVFYYSDKYACVVVEDLGSTNGTFVNGVQVDCPIALRNKDEVAVGLITLHYFEELEDATDTRRQVNRVAVPVKTFGMDDVAIGTNTESLKKF